jgi:predicted ATPase with chaperone activity
MALGEKTNSILFARNPLCPCGKAKLGRPRKCGFSLYKCRSVLERLSADDFSIFDMVLSPTESFFELYPHPELDLESLNFRKEKAYRTQEKRGQLEPNSRLDLFDLKRMMSDEAKHCAYIPVVNSLDRTRSVLAVARSCADLEGSALIEKEHIEKAVLLSYKAAKEVSRAF